MNLKRIRTSFFLILLTYSQTLFANYDLAQKYFEQTESVLLDLKNAGIDKIACTPTGEQCLSPERLLNTLGAVKFVVTSDFEKPELATRMAAFFSPSEKTIYLNNNVKHEESTLGFVGLHELLGLEEKNDTEFRISLASYQLIRALNNNLQDSDDWVETLKKEIEVDKDFFVYHIFNTDILNANNQIASGGATVVGGGGDGWTFVQRILLIEYLTKSMKVQKQKFDKAFIKRIMDLPIEVVDTSSSEIVYIKKPRPTIETSSWSADMLTQRQLTVWPAHILVPRQLTSLPALKNPQAPNKAIEDIVNYISSLNVLQYPNDGVKDKILFNSFNLY